jgi:transposase-like protein
MKAGEVPDCPYCSTSCKPERIGAVRYLCPVCSRIFLLPKS